MNKDDQQSNHESNTKSKKTQIDPDAERALVKSRMEKRYEQGVTSSTTPGMEVQLNLLFKAVTDATDAAKKEMKK